MRNIFYIIFSVISFAFVCGACVGGDASNSKSENDSSKVTNEIGDEYDSVIVDSLPTIIDFYAVWCRPCNMIAPDFESLKEKYSGKINFVRIDVDKDEKEALKYQIEAMPTFVFLDRDGNEIDRLVGADVELLKTKTEQLSKIN